MADSNSYPVRKVYEVFKTLEAMSRLEAFLKECDQKELTLDVGPRVFAVGHHYFGATVAKPGEAAPEAVGPPCPLCSDPPR